MLILKLFYISTYKMYTCMEHRRHNLNRPIDCSRYTVLFNAFTYKIVYKLYMARFCCYSTYLYII